MVAPLATLGIGLLALGMCISNTALAEGKSDGNNSRAKRFVDQYEATVRPMEIEAARLFWTANVTGKDEDYQKKQDAEEKIDLALSDPARFAELKAIRTAGVADPLLARQIEILYLGYLGRQIPPALLQKISAKSNAVEQAFNVFRPVVDGHEISANEVNRILRESRDSAERRAVWEAGKKAGRAVVGDLKELVALRNEAARKLGFKNYHAMRLTLGEQNEEQLVKLFDQLEELTREPFREAKREMDAALARQCGITVAELRPWHYQDPFFQEAPAAPGELPEAVYKQLDTVKVCRTFYAGIGLPIGDVLDRGDLYEKPGKCPHAFMIDIDREGDVRILENVVPGREWLGTTMHELGHATYSKNLPRDAEKGTGPICRNGPEGAAHKLDQSPFPPQSLPYVLRGEAHAFCTEGVAMMFERFVQNVDWLQAMGAKIPDPEGFRKAAARIQRNRLLVFARYCQVMFRFERELYANPDQDLNRLWWDMVEKYQEIKRPEGRDEPDYAAKYHFVGAPVYYHNYMMGEMFASQLHHAMIWRGGLAGVTPDTPLFDITYVGNKNAGKFLCEKVYAPGMTLNWNEMIRRATGEELNAKAFAEDIGASPKKRNK